MEQVKSPYNFVPAPTEDQVFKPNWASQVSHDIPFEDGQSGELAITITAETPIFIRNGHAKPVDGESPTSEFSHVMVNGEKQYFIPATSIKGMLRNVLEIMSFSRLNKNLVNDDRYSYRDLTNNAQYLLNYKKFEIKAGWLIEDNYGNWQIEETKEFAFIHHAELYESSLKIPFINLFKENPKDKSAKFKYNLVGLDKLNVKCITYIKELFGNVKRNMAKVDENGMNGTLVFTGQSSKRKQATNDNEKSSGKVHEFVFFNNDNPTFINVSDSMKKDFQFIYLDHDKNNISKDWKFWRDSKLTKGQKVPIFYSKNSNGKLEHFGLSYMYKLPFKNSVHQMAPLNMPLKDGDDFANILFGSTINDGLKGRVFVGNALCVQQKELVENNEILGSPKASYFPFYLKQENKSLVTFDSLGTINGYKRYSVKNSVFKGNYDQNQSEKVFSKFVSLGKGTIFSGKIRFHNLKKVELGALISTITFHNNLDFSHSIGGAKPYGFGKVKVEVNMIKAEYLDSIFDFENRMNEHINDNVQENLKWLFTPQIVELFSNSKPNQTTEENLVYPRLKFKNEDNKDKNEFVEYKKNKLFLVPTSNTNGKPTIKPFKSQKMLDELILTFNLENINTFSDLQNKIREELSDNVPDNLHQLIISKIKEIYIGHKDSRKKLSKPYDEYFVKTPIIKWIGEESAQKLHKELTSKSNG